VNGNGPALAQLADTDGSHKFPRPKPRGAAAVELAAAKLLELAPPTSNTLKWLVAETNRMTPRRSRGCAGALFVSKEKTGKPKKTPRAKSSLQNRDSKWS
jgi:hypothetical protein